MNYFVVVAIIGLLILLHEAGHLYFSKKAGIPVEIFSVGFGPKLWSVTRGGTEYRLSLIPLGGYVMPAMRDENDYFALPVHKRIIAAIGGPLFNILGALLAAIPLTVIAQGLSFRSCFIEPVLLTAGAIAQMAAIIPQLFTSPEHLSGIVGIVSQSNALVGASLVKTLGFILMLNLNLAILNLLPIPALDGGKILLCLLEKIHPKLRKAHIPLSIAGWLLLIGVLFLTTVQDIGKLIPG